MDITYWNQDVETLDRAGIEAIQLERLKKLIGQSFKTGFFKKRLEQASITSPDDIKSLDDVRRLPFNVKDDLRQNFPTGLLAVGMEEVVRIHSSSGTTGIPTVIYLTADDMENWTDLLARSIVATGCSKKDVFQNMMTYGLFTGGIGLHYGAERVGMTVIPVGGGNTQRQVQIMKDFKTTVLHVTPSYLLHIHSKLESFGVSPKELNIEKAFLGAEPYSENTRLKLEALYGLHAFNSYGLSEMNGPGVAFECIYRQGMHVWEDAYILEIIDPVTGEQLPDGEKGEVVLTNLVRSAMPLFRYRTRDLAYVINEPCRCGRTHRRLSRIQGRTDDMMIINGVNVFPSQIEEVIMAVPEVGTNYLIHLTKAGSLDKLTVKVEIYSKMFTGDLNELDRLKKKITEKLRASITINPHVELHEPGALPHSEGKAKRVLDERDEL
ncbi:MAG: phenylacetate--CoA ligase family protein [Planctomycetota bacterium]|jgi:phenylacetate-CoA ligase